MGVPGGAGSASSTTARPLTVVYPWPIPRDDGRSPHTTSHARQRRAYYRPGALVEWLRRLAQSAGTRPASIAPRALFAEYLGAWLLAPLAAPGGRPTRGRVPFPRFPVHHSCLDSPTAHTISPDQECRLRGCRPGSRGGPYHPRPLQDDLQHTSSFRHIALPVAGPERCRCAQHGARLRDRPEPSPSTRIAALGPGCGCGTWTRTRITRSRIWRATIAPSRIMERRAGVEPAVASYRMGRFA